MTEMLTPASAAEALLSSLRAGISCTRDGDALQLDTPLPLPDGHLLRVYVEAGSGTTVVISDGGFAINQAEIFAPSAAALRSWQNEFKRIATEAGLEWNGEFRIVATDLGAAMQRITGLAIAVERALALMQPRTQRARLPLRTQLGADLRLAGKPINLKVEPNAHIAIAADDYVVTVNYRVQRGMHEAAVDVLAGRTEQGATRAVDRTITNFHALAHGGYEGMLVAVYDEDSMVADPRYQRRFKSAKPDRALFIPGSNAAAAVIEHLAA